MRTGPAELLGGGVGERERAHTPAFKLLVASGPGTDPWVGPGPA